MALTALKKAAGALRGIALAAAVTFAAAARRRATSPRCRRCSRPRA
ncbi:MAG TPA: hypothetical protein VK472_07030 [Allosphingosinicella sp.]|nr:hypothetical protein [Allosphingosinicella sp.]